MYNPSHPSYIEGNPTDKNPKNTPYTNPTAHIESKKQSNNVAKPELIGRVQIMSVAAQGAPPLSYHALKIYDFDFIK